LLGSADVRGEECMTSLRMSAWEASYPEAEISFIQYFPLFSCKQYDVITDLICIMKKVNISKTKKDISKRKTPFFCILKGLSDKLELFFVSKAL